MQKSSDLLTREDLQARLGVSKRWVFVNIDRIPGAVRLGRKVWRFRRADVEAALLKPRFLLDRPAESEAVDVTAGKPAEAVGPNTK